MYARQVSLVLKPDSHAELVRRLESEIVPLLRQHEGFRDELSFVNPTGRDAFAVSLWDSREHAEAYDRAAYARVYDLLAGLIEGRPRVRGYEVTGSTARKISAQLQAA